MELTPEQIKAAEAEAKLAKEKKEKDEAEAEAKRLEVERINSIVAARVKKEKEKNISLEEKVKQLEKDAEKRKATEELESQILTDNKIKENETHKVTKINELVKEKYIDSVLKLVSLEVDVEEATIAEIDKAIEEVIKSMPSSVKKGSGGGTTPTKNTETTETNTETKTKYYLNGRLREFTKEEYEALSEPQRSLLKKSN